MKRRQRERVQDSGETQRETECVRDGAWQREEAASVVKWAVGENVMGEMRIILKGQDYINSKNNFNYMSPTANAIFT